MVLRTFVSTATWMGNYTLLEGNRSLLILIFFKLFQLAYYKGGDTFVALLELTCKRKYQPLCSNAKLGSLFDDDSDDGRLDNVNRQLYPGESQSGKDGDQGSKNGDETPKHQESRLTGNTTAQSTPYLNILSATPKADLLVEGDGSIVISWYGKTNLLDDRGAFITDFGTAIPPIYST